MGPLRKDHILKNKNLKIGLIKEFIKFKIWDKKSSTYRPELTEVIKGINFNIEKYEKIGVIGRTGNGKSTMTLEFLRILELSEENNGDKGRIILDEINIEKIGLNYLGNSARWSPRTPFYSWEQ